MSSVTLKNLSKSYAPEVAAVAGVNLQVQDGELLALLGPSGSGKTTILRLIAGLLRPTAGDILFAGQSVLRLPPEKRGAVMVFQDHALFPFMSVGDNLAFGLKLRKLDKATIAQRVGEALAAVQLAGFESRWPEQLSGGQRQRVALARALIIRPKILLLDEPLSNLDQSLRHEMRSLIRQLQRDAGITTLLVTHDQAEAIAIADRIALLLDGQLRQVGDAHAFFQQPADLDVARFFGATNFIPAIKRGSRVETAFGALNLPKSTCADGAVEVVIRPEQVEIVSEMDGAFRGVVDSAEFKGITTQLRILISDTPIFVNLPPQHNIQIGDQLFINLPSAHISLFPQP